MNDNQPAENCMSRKRFLFLTATTLAAAGCESLGPASTAAGSKPTRVIDAGPETAYSADGVYENFRAQGFFLIRSQGKLTAISSYCTHRHCKLDAEPDHSFSCPCHDSTFDPHGKVTEGPATRDLPGCPLMVDSRRHVMVTIV
ncbi:MAG: Rieske (2Fe-2S) protein [Luteolibacter sp.]